MIVVGNLRKQPYLDFYHEAHITIQPSSNADWENFVNISKELGWKASRFEEDHVDDANGLWFLSFRTEANERQEMIDEVIGMVHGLQFQEDLKCVRWKIEQTVADSKLGHELDHL